MVVVVVLAGWPRFFIGAAMGLTIGGAMGLAIGGAVLMGTNVAVGFSRLSLW